MSPRTVERVDDWETVPFGGGYSGLRDLASQEFSGVVTAGPTRLFMIRGTVVGVLDGSIDDFDGASGNAREAPHPALPLLAVMQERSDEVRAKYYTEDTPIADVDRTLADGSFTGFVELSENVLSGDYYQVYHQGRSMSVAYVGTTERLITDDEAFEQANDEVGIYEVRPVAIEPIDIPEPADETRGGAAAGTSSGDESSAATSTEDADESAAGGTVSNDDDTVDIPSATAGSDATDADAGETTSTAAAADARQSDATEPDTTETDAADESVDEAEPRTAAAEERNQQDSVTSEPGDATDDASAGGADEMSPSTDETESSRRTERDESSETTGQSRTDRDAEAGGDPHPGANVSSSASSADTNPSQRPDAGAKSQSTRSDSQSPQTAGGTDRTQADRPSSGTGNATAADSGGQAGRAKANSPSAGAGAADLEVRSIPSLDPGRTSTASKATAQQTAGGRGSAAQSSQPRGNQRATQSQQRSSDGTAQRSPDGSTQQSRQDAQKSGRAARSGSEPQATESESTQSSSPSGSGSSELAGELESREQEIEDLRTDLERVEAERDDLETKAAELESERDRLRAELDEAQAEIERLTDRLDDFAAEGDAAGTQLSAGEAIDNTNLFVRYRSKGDATLETAHSGNADRSAVEENMRLEYHTQFDADDAAVGNEPFDDFLRDTIQYRFVDWIIRSLLYEVRDTGHADGMADLYNALPKIDRAELNGQVSVTYSEDGEEHRSQERFDVVVRDRMGNPLIVANINNSRDPATDAMMTDLIKRAGRVGESSETLAGAFLVTESFFEPEALETAEGATSSGLFSRDKRKSFVNLSRKGGYHLCLVEARNQEFHLAVPEL